MTIDYREVRAAGLGIGVVALYTLFVLSTGLVGLADYAALVALYIKGSLALWGLLGLIGLFVLLVKHGRGPINALRPSPFVVIAGFFQERWRRDRLLSMIWPPFLFAVLMASFNAFKQLVLIGAGFRFDALFAGADRLLFLGHDPWTVTHALFSSPFASYAIDHAYHGWFAPMSVGVLLCAWASRDSYRLRTQYLLSYIAIWVLIGSVFAYLLPAAGPCFYPVFSGGAPQFQALIDRLAQDQAVIQQSIPGARLESLAAQAGLMRAYGAHNLAVGGGISAMPSVHNGLSALFALAAFRINRKLGWVMTFYAALIWVGSIHLGWHYAIDGIVSIAMTCGIWRTTGRIADRLERPLFAGRKELVPA